MGFLKGLVNLMTLKCGEVTKGKYAGTAISAGNDSGKAVTVGPVDNNQLIFLKGTKEIARVNIEKEIRDYTAERSARGMILWLSYADGDESFVELIAAMDKPDPMLPINTILTALENHCKR